MKTTTKILSLLAVSTITLTSVFAATAVTTDVNNLKAAKTTTGVGAFWDIISTIFNNVWEITWDYIHLDTQVTAKGTYNDVPSTKAVQDLFNLWQSQIWNTNGPGTIFYSSWSVGIGTKFPSTKLEVDWTAKFQDTVYMGDKWIISFSPDIWGGEAWVILQWNTGNGVLIRGDGGVGDWVIVKSNGNVWIGTSTPSYKFDVAWRIRGDSILLNKSTVQNWGAHIAIERADNTTQGVISFTTNSDGTQNWILWMWAANDDLVLNAQSNANLRLVTQNNKNILLLGGNVWIWTVIPSEKLEVKGHARINTNGNYSYLALWQDSRDNIFSDNKWDGYYGGWMWFRVDNGAGGYTDSMTLAENWNIWIWVINPTTRLDVNGKIRTNSYLSLSPWQDNTAVYWSGEWRMWYRWTGGTSGAGENMIHIDWSTGLSVAGNVWIGTINPGAKLHIESSGDAELTSTGHWLTVWSQSGLNLAIDWNEILARNNGASSDLFLQASSSTANTIINREGWNVWIWTPVPREKLDVRWQIVGGFGALSTGGSIDWNDVTNARWGNWHTLLQWNAAHWPWADAGANYFHPFSFEYGWAKNGTWNMTQFAIPYHSAGLNKGVYLRSKYSWNWTWWHRMITEDSSHNVWIGTTNPTAKLDVAGTIKASSSLTLNGNRTIYFDSQYLYGNNGAYLYHNSNHNTVTGMIFRDKQSTKYWYIYWDWNWSTFWILDGDWNWAVKSVKDSFVELRDNNEVTFAAGQGWVSGTYGTVSTKWAWKNWWNGYSLNWNFVFMWRTNDVWIYNDTDNEWMMYNARNGAVNLYYNWANKFQTTNDWINVSWSATATSFLYSSDRRLKKNISKIPSALSKITQLKWVNFNWKKSWKSEIGFIAQDVEKVLPELVVTDDKGMKAVKYGNISAVLVEAVKQQQTMIEKQSKLIQQLQIKVDLLK